MRGFPPVGKISDMTRRLGVALLPRPDHMRSAVRAQRDVGGGQVLRPPLALAGNLPHLTIFQGPFTDAVEPERELKRVIRSAGLPREVRLAFTGIVHQPIGWVFLTLERPPLLENLQATTLSHLTPHLDRDAFKASEDTYTEAERASATAYGYRYTGDAYLPHITLGRAEEQTARELTSSAPARTRLPSLWVFDRMSFYVMGEHGAHAQTLALAPLTDHQAPTPNRTP